MFTKPPFKADLNEIKYEYLACFVCMLMFLMIVASLIIWKH